MKRLQLSPTDTLADSAQQILRAHFKKACKLEAAVLRDVDPEDLHQMRVEMRRLRTALQVFHPILLLPKAAGLKRIRKIAQTLGSVRDLDVLQETLLTRYRQDLSDQNFFEQVIQSLHRQRDRSFSNLGVMISSPLYRKFRQALQGWLDHPRFTALAHLRLEDALPDLLLPVVSQLLLHPGWLLGTPNPLPRDRSHLPPSCDLIPVLASQAEVLHDLRKHLKRVRYQAEFFLGCYAPAFADLIKDFQALQDILGQLQDLSVLRGFLTHTWREDWPETCPQLLHHLQQEQRKNWQQWLSAQQRYLDPQVRQTVRQGFLSLNLHPEPANLTARGSIT